MPARKKRVKIDKNREIKDLLIISFTILLMLLTMLNLQKQGISSNVLGVSSSISFQDLENEKKYWEEVLFENPTYRDGWIRMSEIELLLGNLELSSKYARIAQRISLQP